MSAEQRMVNDARRVIRNVLRQAREDPSYKERFYTSPRETLVQAGLSDEVADHLVKYELPQGFTPDAPSGQDVDQAALQPGQQLYCHATCDFWSCIITTCTWFTGV